jgi:hypothetical protein
VLVVLVVMKPVTFHTLSFSVVLNKLSYFVKRKFHAFLLSY